MAVPVDYQRIQSILNKYTPDHPVTEAEAAAAFHNLVGFIKLLLQIERRVGPDLDNFKCVEE